MTVDKTYKKFFFLAHLKEGGQLYQKIFGVGDNLGVVGKVQSPIGNALAEQDDNIVNFFISILR